MNILYYCWAENSAADMIETLDKMGHSVYAELHELSFYFSEEFAPLMRQELCEHSYDIIFTFNFIPTISDIAEEQQIPYVSWVYDCPHITLYSNSLHNSCNYLFLFDRDMQQTALSNHAKHAFHQPLAIATDRLAAHLQISAENSAEFFPQQYQHDISFVGSLYEKNSFEPLKNASPHLQGYLSGIMAAQKQVWGADLISAVLSPERVAEIYPFLPFVPSANEFITAKDIFTTIIQRQITSEERIEAINRLSELSPVALYSDSDASLCPKAMSMGTVSYTEQMPDVFYRSKINLNVTLRSITSGIPLRAIDILGCGGFLLSNYQPELCEFFTPDVDFVYFEDMDDMVTKAAYYLTHDKEREKIAYHGYQTVTAHFSYYAQIQKILDTMASCL
jgi:spore maturation protein CgeB